MAGLNEDAAAFRFLQLTEAETRIARGFSAALEAKLQIGRERSSDHLG